MGVAVTFIAILELVREGLIDIVQQEPFAPIHVRAAAAGRHLRVVADNTAEPQVNGPPLIHTDVVGPDEFDDGDDADLDEDLDDPGS